MGNAPLAGARAGAVSATASRLIEQLTAAWDSGREALAEQILADNPIAAEDREVIFQLIYEEICLRQKAGQESATVRVLNRFPQWRSELELLVDCHRLLEPDPPPVLPEVGQRLGEFQLLAELGRGARGRVFLAAQSGLADRPVVFKVTPREGSEHLSLARLQHAHIVPLYFVQAFPVRRLQGLCMPYLGGLTLAAVLAALSPVPPTTRSGRQLLGTIEEAPPPIPLSLPSGGPVHRFLRHASYDRAVCWLGCCLADALHYAHERDLVHLDVKPSNILLTAGGEPMLLDFHLARGPLSPCEPAPDWLGGTPGYMAPEQEQALAAVREGRPVPARLDGRADVYSLGMVLYEALGGLMPLPPRASPRRLLRGNPQVSPGLADILGKCLMPDPAQRYASAAALAADLRCHLADLPLHGAPNRSWRERWHKWRRRSRSIKLSTLLITLALGTALAAMGSGLLLLRQRHVDADADRIEGQQHLEQHRHAEAARLFNRARARLDNLPFQGRLREGLANQLRLARRGEIADCLHRLTDRLRFVYGHDALPRAVWDSLDRQCRAAWDARDILGDPEAPRFEEAFEARIQVDLFDLAVLWADLRVRFAGAGASEAARADARRLLQEARELLGPGVLLDELRLLDADGQGRPKDKDQTPRTAWGHFLLGRSLFRRGELARAATRFDEAIRRQPSDLWTHLYRGLCCYRLQRFGDALTEFSICIALAPDRAECYFNRALAHVGLRQSEAALQDYDQALRLDPHLARAAFNRAVLHLQADHLKKARAGFQQALRDGIEPAVIHYHLALVALVEEDPEAARASLDEALRHDPGHEQARQLRETLKPPTRSDAPKREHPRKTRNGSIL